MSAATNKPGAMRSERTGIRDVAAAAGVSITTVSDALNGKGRLPEATRQHVREVADRLGYRPSAAARTLRTGRSGLIGLTVTGCGGEPFTRTEFPYFTEMASAATSAALGRGYALVILPATPQHDLWGNVALDGTVVVDPTDDDPVVAELVRRGVPMVSDGLPGHTPVRAWVDNDHEASTLGVLDHLVSAGARRIGLLTSDRTDAYTRLSVRAYLAWCQRIGQQPVVESHRWREPGSGAHAADQLLARPDRPDAVYGLYDPTGGDLLAAARRHGLRVPEDLLVACCSESPMYAATDPPVTTLSLGPRRIGATTVELLIDALQARPPAPRLRTTEHRPVGRLLPTDLVTRQSTQRTPPRAAINPPRVPGTR